jgi:hypothetical protein
VLHTRVPELLEQELKRLADSLRIPVSNLIRTVLEDAVAAADRVGRLAEGELRVAADRLADERGRLWKLVTRQTPPLDQAAADEASARAENKGSPTDATQQLASRPPDDDPLTGVLGWQQMVLARAGRCDRCQRLLTPGDVAYSALRTDGGAQMLIGTECLHAVSNGTKP